MEREIDLQKAVAVLPRFQQRWIVNFVRFEIRKPDISDPKPNPSGQALGYLGGTLAGSMIATGLMMGNAKDAVAEAEALLRRSGSKAISSAIATGLVEIKAFKAASDAAEDADLEDVMFAVDRAVVKSVFENNPSVRRAKLEAESRPKLDPVLIKELIDMPAGNMVLLTEAEAVERAGMAISYTAALYAKYFGVLSHLAGRRFREWERYALPVRTFWELCKKGYVVLGTALPESGDKEVINIPYACAMLRGSDADRGGSSLVEIQG